MGDDTVLEIAQRNLGQETAAFVERKNPKTVADLYTILTYLTPTDINQIRREVRHRLDLQQIKNLIVQQQVPSRQQSYNTANTPGTSGRPSPTPTLNNSVTPPTPFPDTPDGQHAYAAAVTTFYTTFGLDAKSSVSRPHPLSPGTLPAGSGECWRCGRGGHSKVSCSNQPIPEQEQRYR
jgi:hypothetical protein